MANYKVNNGSQNLTNIFQSIGSTTPVSDTRYKSSGSDLSTIFAGFVNGTHALPTSYIVNDFGGIIGNNKDLSDIFQHDPIIPYAISGSTNYTTSILGTTYTLTFNPGSFTINFFVNLSINVLVVGGGGGGGGGSNTAAVSGGGGGSGGIGTDTILTSIASYAIEVGANGTAGNGNQPGGNGGNSSFGTTFISTGGGGGNANFGGGSQAAGTSTVNSIFGGNGGNGFNVSAGTSGQPATSGSYGGGGGGGNNASKGGKSGLNGLGGTYGAYTSIIGEPAISYGSGGGGGANSFSSGVPIAGGIGGKGVVIITFTY